jgi:hypothetical protein
MKARAGNYEANLFPKLLSEQSRRRHHSGGAGEHARVLRVTLVNEPVASPDTLDAALNGLLRQRVEALYPTQSLLAHRAKVGDFAMANRLPLFTRSSNWPWLLLSYGVSRPDLFRLVARQIVQILKGVKPATCRSSRPRSSRWWSTSRPPKPSASPSRRRCWRGRTT